MPANLENSSVATGLETVSFYCNHKEMQCQKMLKIPIALISNASKGVLKILQARLQHYVNIELPDVQAEFRKGRGTRPNCQHPLDHRKSERIAEKTSMSALLTTDYTAFDCVHHNKLWEILKQMGIPDHLTCLLRNLYAGQEAIVTTGHGTTGSKSGK